MALVKYLKAQIRKAALWTRTFEPELDLPQCPASGAIKLFAPSLIVVASPLI